MQNAGHVDVYVIPAHIKVRNVGMSVVSCKPGVETRNAHRASVSVCRPQMGGRCIAFTARDDGTVQSAAVYAAQRVGLKSESSQRLGTTRKLRDSSSRHDKQPWLQGGQQLVDTVVTDNVLTARPGQSSKVNAWLIIMHANGLVNNKFLSTHGPVNNDVH